MLELAFEIDPDANGIIDGRDLARALVQTAYRLLTPYVQACPACSDALFSAIANDAIAELHTGESLPGEVLQSQADPDGAQWKRHLAETDGFTVALLHGTDDSLHIH